ncbi:MAG: hypothetical protein GY701_36080 [Sulfitobacter sp.]|nr:hypothetical protein [Sulfitobacter sp.]
MAKEHHARGRYRNAIVDCATAFEIFLAEFISFHAQQSGMSLDEVEAELLKDRTWWREASELAKTVLRGDPLRMDFAGTAEYQNWDRHVRKPRSHRSSKRT